MNTITIKPGMLVSLKTSLRGNVAYARRNVSNNITDKTAHEVWETEKTVQDIAEHETGKKARADARNAISAACIHSAFGLLCPSDNASKLEEGIAKANAIIEAFNSSAKLTRIALYVIAGKIAEDDESAQAAMASEITDLFMTVLDGMDKREIAQMRDACNKLRNMSGMLTESDIKGLLEVAVDMTREIARHYVKAGQFGSQENPTRDAINAVLTKINA